jgi:hypothetical protein
MITITWRILCMSPAGGSDPLLVLLLPPPLLHPAARSSTALATRADRRVNGSARRGGSTILRRDSDK